jgi:serine/threonine-protein kinase
VKSLPPPPSSIKKARCLARASHIARVQHPNLVRLLPLPGGAGFSPVLNDSRSLADIASRGGTRRLGLEQSVRLLLDVLKGISALHEVSLDGEPFVHGQIAPQHIYVDAHGKAQLVPLLSSHLNPEVRRAPNGYVAPELLVGDQADARADVFSVGVMLWETIAGRPLFSDTSPDAMVEKMVGGKVPPLTPPARAAWAAPLCAVALRAISANPAHRYASALELSNAIALAGGLHLAAARNGDWPDEAPTAVKPPRPHQVPRTVTPLTTVVDIAPPSSSKEPPPLPAASLKAPPAMRTPISKGPPPLPASISKGPPPLPASARLVSSPPPLPRVEPSLSSPPPRAPRRRGRLALAAAAPLAAIAFLVAAPQLGVPLPAVSLPALTFAGSGSPAQQPATAPAAARAAYTELPPAAAPPPAAPSASTPPTTAPSASVTPAASAAPAASAHPVTPSIRSAPARGRSAAPAPSDYGI